jgi:hypoxia up-regulated 1
VTDNSHREEFEALAGDFFVRAAAPVAELLQRNPEAAKNLSAVELLGGGTRVPRLQAALSQALGGRTLDK